MLLLARYYFDALSKALLAIVTDYPTGLGVSKKLLSTLINRHLCRKPTNPSLSPRPLVFFLFVSLLLIILLHYVSKERGKIFVEIFF